MVKAPRSEKEAAAEKDREQRGREKEGEAWRTEEFSEEAVESDSLTVGSQPGSERPSGVCVSARGRVAASGNMHG